MTDLIDRIEAATGADRELFEEAFVAAFGPEPESKYDGRAWKRGEPDFAPEWTAYIKLRCRYRQLIDVGAWLEAAAMLVPDLALFHVKTLWNRDRQSTSGYAIVNRYKREGLGLLFARDFYGDAATPALALCAAALKARESEG